MELDTSKLSGQISGAKRSLTGLGDAASDVGEQSKQGFGQMVKASALGNLAAIGLSKGIGMITSSVGGAIKRVDTLNNSNRTFENMGFEAGVSAKSVENLTKSIMGLPTPLDSAMRGMTSLAATYGDIDKGQKVFSALNNAILGFGGSAAMVDNAITQLSQLPMDGPLDAQTWNSLRNSGLTPVLVAMAEESGMSVSAMKEAFGEGELTVQDFTDRLIKMNTEGGGSLKSLETIAKDSTKGMGTGFANMQTAITRGVGKIIEAVGSERIAKAMSGIGTAFETGLTAVATGIEAVMPTIITIFEGLGKAIDGTTKFITGWVDALKEGNPLVQAATVFLGAFAAGIAAVKVATAAYNVVLGLMYARVGLSPALFGVSGLALKAYTVATTIATAATGAFGAVMAVVTSPVFLVVAAIAALIAIGFLVVKNWDTIKAAATKVLGAAWTGIKTGLAAVGTFFTNTWNGIKTFFTNAINGIVMTATTMWTNLKLAFQTGVTAVVTFFQQLPYNIGLAIGTIVRFFWDLYTVKIPEFVMGVLSWIGQLPGKIAEFFTSMKDKAITLATGLITGVIDWFSKLPGRIAEFLSNAWTFVTNGFTNIKNSAINLASSAITSVVDWFAQLPGRVWSAITGLAGKVGGIIDDVKTRMTEGASSAIENTVTFFKELPGKIMDAIGGLAGSIGDKFKSIAADAWAGFKDGLGIHSPSYIEEAFMAIEDQGKHTTTQMNRDMSRLNNLARSAQRIEPFGAAGGADFAAGAVPSSGGSTTYNITLPNVREPEDFAREFKLATTGRGA